MILNGYWSFEGFEHELAEELKKNDLAAEQYGRLFISTQAIAKPLWAQLVLADCRKVEFKSISEAAKILKSLGKRWASSHSSFHRRAELIQEQVFKYKIKSLDFLAPMPNQDWGFWTLLSENILVAAASTESAFPCGEIQFNEDKENAPSRAYLKLWEIFTVHKIRPQAGDRVLDLGSSPGGWTWVLQQIGCQVLSIDKAELDPRVAKLARVESLKKDAFKLRPEDAGPIDWLFSDLICYPPKLYDLIQMWRESGLVKNFVCTIKFQGSTDYETLKKLALIPESRLVHLVHNKHEVTWINLRKA